MRKTAGERRRKVNRGRSIKTPRMKRRMSPAKRAKLRSSSSRWWSKRSTKSGKRRGKEERKTRRKASERAQARRVASLIKKHCFNEL
jgi:hypothetical protein